MIDISTIADRLATTEGVFVLNYGRLGWTAGIEWGKEAPDSPMCAAAAYGVGDTAAEAVAAALGDAGWAPATT